MSERGSLFPFLAFYDAENVYQVEAATQEDAERAATEAFGPGWEYVERA